jgi:hypothetical protein
MRSVPLVRYFVAVGGFLLAMLFVASWYWQNPSPMPSYGRPIDEAIVRIRSAHKWPEKVELNTTIPITVPPSPPSAETAKTAIPPAPKPALNALAQANLSQKQVAKRKPTAHVRNRRPNGAGELRFAVNPMLPARPAGW